MTRNQNQQRKGQCRTQTSHNLTIIHSFRLELETWRIKYSKTHPFHSDSTMRALTLTWTPITLVLVILVTCTFHTQAQSRRRTITKAQIEEIVKNYKPAPTHIVQSPPEYIEPLDQKLYRLLNCTQIGRRCDGVRLLVIKELLLRLQTRDMGEECTSHGKYSTALYESPLRLIDAANTRVAYEAWQDELLDTGLTFCRPFLHLSCSSISKKCECRPGTIYKPELGIYPCEVIVGGNCWIPGIDPPAIDNLALYDPLTRDFRESNGNLIIRPFCPVGGIEKFSFLGCTVGLKLFLNNICADEGFIDLDRKLDTQFKTLPKLNFGATCNLEHQTQLLTTTDAEINDYKIRVKNLEAILAAKTPFCDFELLVMCGSGGKCECIKPMTYNPDTKTCGFKNPQKTCQEQSAIERMTDLFPGRIVREVREFRNVRDQVCPLGCAEAKFPGGRPVVPKFTFCRPCKEVPESNGLIQLIGKNCDKDLTLFLEGAPPPSLPIDIPEYEKQVELFVQFNEKAKEFEKLFQFEENSPCDFEGELEVYRTIRRIKNVEFPDKIFTEQNYRDLMSSMDKIIGQFGGKAGLCRYRLRGQPISEDPPGNRPILLCGPTAVNSICYEPNNTFYLDELMKRLSGISSEATPGGACAPHVRDILKYAEEQYGRFIESNRIPILLPKEYEYLFNTLENHWIDNSQFCNRTVGFKCTKSVDDNSNGTGKCEFSSELLKEVEAELEAERMTSTTATPPITSKSSHHSIQHLLSTLLVILHIILLN